MRYVIRAVPTRRRAVEDLQETLPEALVVWDLCREPLLAWGAAFQAARGEPFVHVEDDMVFTPRATRVIARAARQLPGEVISFYQFYRSERTGRPKRMGWMDFHPGACVYFPEWFVSGYWEWAQGAGWISDEFMLEHLQDTGHDYTKKAARDFVRWKSMDTSVRAYLQATGRTFVRWGPPFLRHTRSESEIFRGIRERGVELAEAGGIKVPRELTCRFDTDM